MSLRGGRCSEHETESWTDGMLNVDLAECATKSESKNKASLKEQARWWRGSERAR